MRSSRRWFVLMLAVSAVLLSGCQPSGNAQSQQSLSVFAASSLTDAFNEIGLQFKADQPGVEVVLNYGSSSQLAAQINEGGQADVFASASTKAFQPLISAGHVTGAPIVFATNRLVLITPASNPAKIARLHDLAKPGVKLVLAIKGVPIRDYADQILATTAVDASFRADFAKAVYANLVSEEDNVRQVVSKVALGEADAGIVYVTDVTPEMAPKLNKVDIPDNLNISAMYPIGLIAESKQPELAKAFVDFVLSEKGQAILVKWGFGPAPIK